MIEVKAVCNQSNSATPLQRLLDLALSIHHIQRGMPIYRQNISSEYLKNQSETAVLKLMAMRSLISVGTGSTLSRTARNYVQFECLDFAVS